MSKEQGVLSAPKDGWEGFKENFAKDATSGFVVFLLALPLSLGIASASEFPPIMGVVSAIIGGLLATFFTGSQLAIKGPAAGLIVIVAGAVNEFGGGVQGWRLALGVMVAAGILQILFGLLKWGKFVDIFPLSAVHGMLAAIGLIIIAKQIPVLLNVNPELMAGKGPLALFAAIPEFFANLDPQVSIIGGVSLAIMLGWGLIKHPILKQIPAPLLVLIFAIPAGIYMNLSTTAPDYTLIKVGSIVEQLGINVSFEGLSHITVFIKYVIMVTLVGSLESLLTVKAIDLLDPYKRKADPNKDMIAIGIANTFAAVVGGIPMISEVARSSANVAQGGRTRWANFFHGLFLLVSALAAYQVLEMIPNAALAAMLVAVGIKLAHPKEFIHTYKIGSEQLAIFITTIFFTLFEDLLIGIAAGMLLKAFIHIFRGAPWKSLFKSDIVTSENGNDINLRLGEAAVFTNYLGIKSALDALPAGKNVQIEIGETKLIDHSVMENLHHFEEDYVRAGGQVKLVGLENLTPASEHPLAARRVTGEHMTSNELIDEGEGHFDEAHVFHTLKHFLPIQPALKDFVHHNSLHSFQDKPFFEGIFSATKIFGVQTTLNINEYRKLHQQGRIKENIIDQVITRIKGKENLAAYKQKMLAGKYDHTYKPRVGRLRAEWKTQYQFNIDDRVQPLLFRIIASYLDQGVAINHFPFENKGLLNAIRSLEENSFTSFFKSKRAKKLLFSKDLSLKKLLNIVVGKKAYYEQYLYDQQFEHKGWSGIINAIEDDPKTLLYSKEISLRDFIMLELLLEIDALDSKFGVNWEGLANQVAFAPQDYFAKVEKSELQEVLELWQEAFEWDYYDSVLSAVGHLAEENNTTKVANPTFQSMFCVDDREDSIRRHIEAVDPHSETYGAPGYYGAAFYFQPEGAKFYEKNCPVAITPTHLIREVTSKRKKKKLAFHHPHTHTFVRGFFYSLSLGLFSAQKFLFELFRPKMRDDVPDIFHYMDEYAELEIEAKNPAEKIDGLQVGFTIEEMINIVEGILAGVGLTENFAPLVYILGHGSTTSNNPHYNAYNCGACSGRPGAPNARAFCYMANHPSVRAALDNRGIVIPKTTQFVAGLHDTSSDEIGYYDIDLLSEENKGKHQKNVENIEKALDFNAKERSRRFASIDINQDIKKIRKSIKERSVAYFEPRPELNHGSNALCYVGRRERMQGLFLDRRAFLQSYDPKKDLDGSILKQVLGPLPAVCGGINLEYFFSRMDNEKMGAGTKLPHNVSGLIAVVNSSDGDVRSGLHWQTVENHDPIRLLMMVEHYPEVVLKTIKASPAMYEWFENSWLHLVAVSPDDGKLYQFYEGEFIPYQPLTKVRKTADMLSVIEKAPEMETSHILDATKENMPVYVYQK